MAGGVIKPKKLFKGATIGVMAPSSRMDIERIERSVAKLQDYGFNVFLHPQCQAFDKGSAGTTGEKIKAFHDLFLDPAIDAVMAGRGGSRAIHMLDGLDYELICRHPKLFIGFSDITALHSAIYVQTGLSTVHGADLGRFDPELDLTCAEATVPYLLGDLQGTKWPSNYPMQIHKEGIAEGILFGGNLALLMATRSAGPKYFPDLEGKILIIEDVGEEKTSIDRMMGSLRLAGVFDRVAALVVGQMTNLKDTGTVSFERTIEEIMREHTAGMKGPVVLNAPIGHEHPNIPFPLGIKARLTAPSGGPAQLQLLESPFADA